MQRTSINGIDTTGYSRNCLGVSINYAGDSLTWNSTSIGLQEATCSVSYTNSRTLSYTLGDQLGSSRVTFMATVGSDEVVVTSRNHYYVHGLRMPVLSSDQVAPATLNQGYAYGQPIQGSLGTRMQRHGARLMDLQLGRFTGVDALAESYQPFTPYHYAVNDPVNWTDPSGYSVCGPGADLGSGESNGNGFGGVYWDWCSGSYRDMQKRSVEWEAVWGLMNSAGSGTWRASYFDQAAAAVFVGMMHGDLTFSSNPDTYYDSHGNFLGISLLGNNFSYKINSTVSHIRSFYIGSSTESGILYVSSFWASPYVFRIGNVSGGIDTSPFDLKPLSEGFTSGPSFDIDKAVNYLNNHAYDSYIKGVCGYGARAVRTAIEEGGINTDSRPISASAKDYGPYVQQWGFNAVNMKSYRPMKGDVRVMQGYPGAGFHGHMDMYNGTIWVSDYLQKNGNWPGPGFRQYKPSYQVYRWSK